jgi:hypothetical protein
MSGNEKFLREVIDARLSGDTERLLSYLDTQMVIHFPGRSRLAGDHRGPGAINAKVMEITGRPLSMEVLDVLGSEEHAAGVYLMTAWRDGVQLTWRQMNHYSIRNGLMVEAWQHPFEQAAVDAFFA